MEDHGGVKSAFRFVVNVDLEGGAELGPPGDVGDDGERDNAANLCLRLMFEGGIRERREGRPETVVVNAVNTVRLV